MLPGRLHTGGGVQETGGFGVQFTGGGVQVTGGFGVQVTGGGVHVVGFGVQ